jgi:hypothetical protein
MAKIIKLFKDGSEEDSPILQKLKERDKTRAERVIAAYKLKLKNTSESGKN